MLMPVSNRNSILPSQGQRVRRCVCLGMSVCWCL